MTDSLKFTLLPDGWKFKTIYRSKNRMRFQIKLDQDQAEGFRNFANNVKPPNISMDTFVAGIFFKGVRKLEEELTEKAMEYMVDNREDMEASGVIFDEDGKVSGFDESVASGSIEVIE